MPLSRSVGERSPALAEGDELPPHDRVCSASLPAIDQLYRGLRPRLLRFFRRRAPGASADDMVQQTFTRLVATGVDRTVPIAQPEAYLHRTARNLVIDEAKLAHRRSTGLHVPFDDRAVPASDPVAGLEARDMLRRLDEALLALKPRTREIFLAHRLDGYSYGEIAVRTGLSVKGVEKHMSRAIAHLDRMMSA